RLVAVDGPVGWAPEPERSRLAERELRKVVGGNIRYTPNEVAAGANPYYDWIRHGLELYAAVEMSGLRTIECFPTASWARWAGPRNGVSRAAWSSAALASFKLDGVPPKTNQDERDAIGAALTALAHARGAADCLDPIYVPKVGSAGLLE